MSRPGLVVFMSDEREPAMLVELADLRRRVERLERRFFGEDDSEPPTMPGVGVTPGEREFSESPFLDALGDAFEGLGFGQKEGGSGGR